MTGIEEHATEPHSEFCMKGNVDLYSIDILPKLTPKMNITSTGKQELMVVEKRVIGGNHSLYISSKGVHQSTIQRCA